MHHGGTEEALARRARQQLAQLDHLGVEQLLASIPEDRLAPQRFQATARQHRPRPWRRVLLVAVGLVATLTLVWRGAPTLIPERALELVGMGTAGHHAFLEIQPGTDGLPVGWSTCRPIEVVVNPIGGPADAVSQVREALTAIQHDSGITMHYDGLTGDTIRRPPPTGVLVSWATPQEYPPLAGGVVGRGGSNPAVAVTGYRVYTQGTATLDGPAFAEMTPGTRLAVIEHELGHVMGLDHVNDPRQLM